MRDVAGAAVAVARAATVVVVLGAALAGCGLFRPSGVEVLGAFRVDGEPTVLVVEFSGCEGEAPVRVEESADRVGVLVDVPPSGCVPLHQQRVQLGAPLGDRSVVDLSTGDRVRVEDAVAEGGG